MYMASNGESFAPDLGPMRGQGPNGHQLPAGDTPYAGMPAAKAPANAVKGLHALLHDVHHRIATIETQRRADDPLAGGDSADAMQAQHQRQSTVAMRALLQEELRQIERALQRALGGAYGICEGCGGVIPPRRLQVVPAATLCVACQGARESRDGDPRT